MKLIFCFTSKSRVETSKVSEPDSEIEDADPCSELYGSVPITSESPF